MKKILMVIGLTPMMAVSLELNPSYTPDAVARYKEKADAGDAEAQFLYARALANGDGAKKDTAIAFDYAKSAAGQGFELSYRLVGMGYDLGWGDSSNALEAAIWYGKFFAWAKPAAERGDPWAQSQIAKSFRFGDGVKKNFIEAVKWCRKAAERGDADAQCDLAMCYTNGEGVEANFVEAVKWCRKAAEEGHARAQCLLGWSYDKGKGVERNLMEAVKWYRKAAEQDDAHAQYNLADCYYYGEGIGQNRAEALKWYHRAAEQGYADAQGFLGYCYEVGSGVEKDLKNAVKWYRKAAEQGNVAAMCTLGMCYAYGKGVETNFVEAARCYCKAAEQGHADAQSRLGWCYEKGKGMGTNLVEAIKWYRKAAEQGNAFAQRKLGEYSSKIGESCCSRAATNISTEKTISVARRLQSCEFLLNGQFKQNAKVYLCLFSASWCPPCRAEMPRIAQTYAETLKDDPDIELIHFSRDQNDAKAMAWAKEHDVKFPVVKPRGGNPLDLRCKGIPHLFIIKADGTWLEEGHPMRLFNKEKLRELKGGGAMNSNAKRAGRGGNSPVGATLRDGRDDSNGRNGLVTVDGFTWSYSIHGGEATIVSPKGGLYKSAVSPKPAGDFVIPSSIDGAPVTMIGKFALCDARELTSVEIPKTVTSIGEWAFDKCYKLTAVTIPSSVTCVGGAVFADCPELREIGLEAGNPRYKVVDGVLYTKDMKRLVVGPGGKVSHTIPAGVTDIANDAFRCCRMLRSITIPSGVKHIGEGAFCGTALESVVIPSSVEKIERFAIAINGALTSLVLSEGVKSIGEFAFCSNSGLTSVRIPSSVKYIGKEAFARCKGLESVTMRGERPDSGDKVFDKCDNIKAIHVPSNAKSWAGMTEWQGIPLVFDGE